ncbi:MAG TPA: pilus assembly protein TadG-related protein [Gaiellaceae bacterium]|nr:pilus assembly protein TadG-related protein [Gaiellaceae bacterium]
MQSVTRSRRSERGAVMVMVAAWLPVIALFAAFAVDVGHFFDYSRNLQNRADAAALAGGLQVGNICAGNPTDPTSSPELPIGQMAQLFSGPPGSASDLPYPYSGVGSPPAAFPTFGGYQNVPNLSVSNGTNGANYHVLLNADDYADAGGTNFAIGDFCAGDPTLDKTDKECYGQTNLTGQAADDCAVAAMVDAKVTQGNVPLFFPLLSIQPNISARSRVTIQGIGTATNLKPLGVRDPGAIPCIQVKFVPTGGTGTPPATQTVQLALNQTATDNLAPYGPDVWDNSTDNNNAGDSISIPSGWNLYMQTTLYAQGSSGDCSTMSNPLTYEQSSGILLLNSYGTSAPAAGQPPKIIGNGNGGGVTLLTNNCTHDQYFSNNTSDCSVTVCAIVAFTPGSTNPGLTVNGANMTTSANPLCQPPAGLTGATAWTRSVTIPSASGQHQFTLAWSEHVTGGVSGASCAGNSGNCSGTFGVEQQAFSACNENFNAACGGDPNISGPIIEAVVTTTSGAGGSTIGAFQANTSPNLFVTLHIQGLTDSPRTDRCANGTTQCTLLRVDQGNADGMVDCGEGNGANQARATILWGCPLYGQAATATNPVDCTATAYCGGWMKTPDGSCNNAGRTATTFVDCVNTNNNGATMPQCIQALVVAGLDANGNIDYSKINPNNCHVSGSTCSEDKWLTGNPIDPATIPDPRIVTTFIVFTGDIAGATGNHDLPIRTFASFYVTGWKIHGNGNTVDCGTYPTDPGANEPAPQNLPANSDAIWGHWITYTEPGAGGNGKPCVFNAFGDCAAVLTR